MTAEKHLRAGGLWFGAYGYFEEEQKGILKPGAIAELIVLDRNPLEVDPMELRDLRVLETVKDGGTVFAL